MIQQAGWLLLIIGAILYLVGIGAGGLLAILGAILLIGSLLANGAARR